MLASVMLKMAPTSGSLLRASLSKRRADLLIVDYSAGNHRYRYGALVPWCSQYEETVAYSSVSHLGFVVLGVSPYTNGMDGAFTSAESGI